MRIVNVYKKFLHIIRQHAEALLLYEILMRSIGFLTGSLFVLMLDIAARKNQGSIFINGDLIGFFEGYRLLFLTLAIFTIIYISLVEVVGLCYISVHEERGAHILATLRYSVKRAASILRAYGLHLILAIFLCVFFFPVFDIGPAYLRTIAVPTFVTDEISRYAYLPYAYGVFVIAVIIFIFRSAFTFHIFALNKKDIVTSIRESWRITKRTTHIKELLKWGVIVPAAVFIGMVLLTAGASYLILTVLNALTVALLFAFPAGVSLILYSSWIYLLSTSITLMVGPILISLLSAYLLVRSPASLDPDVIAEVKTFSKKTEQDIKEGINVASNGYMDSRAVIRMLRKPSLVIVLGAISFLTFAYISSRFLYIYDEKPVRPVLISHRGFSETGQGIMENSINAFSAFLSRYAISVPDASGHLLPEPQTVGIETDLQSLSDGTVIVYHDENFKRLYNIDKKILATSHADFDQLFGSSTAVATMASSSAVNSPMQRILPRPELLTDLMGFIAREHVCPALLEVKVYEDIESAIGTTDRAIAEIKNHKLESCAYLGSQDERIIAHIERTAPEILSNQYIYTKAGDVGRLKVADAYSLEYSLINERSIRELRQSGKKIFAWTVNGESTAEQMYAYGVDGIITDDPLTMRLAFESYEKLFSSIDPKIVTLFGKTFIVNLKDVWQFKLQFPLL